MQEARRLAATRSLLLPLRIDLGGTQEVRLIPAKGQDEERIEEKDSRGNEDQLGQGPRRGILWQRFDVSGAEAEDKNGNIGAKADEDRVAGLAAAVFPSPLGAFLVGTGNDDGGPGDEADDGLQVDSLPSSQRRRPRPPT